MIETDTSLEAYSANTRIQGLETVVDWAEHPEDNKMDPSTTEGTFKIRFIPEGEISSYNASPELQESKYEERELSFRELIITNPLFIWLQKDPKALEKVAATDPWLRNNLDDLNECMSFLDNPERHNTNRYMLSRAILEKLVAVSYYAQPFVPRSIVQEIEKGQQTQPTFQNESSSASQPRISQTERNVSPLKAAANFFNKFPSMRKQRQNNPPPLPQHNTPEIATPDAMTEQQKNEPPITISEKDAFIAVESTDKIDPATFTLLDFDSPSGKSIPPVTEKDLQSTSQFSRQRVIVNPSDSLLHIARIYSDATKKRGHEIMTQNLLSTINILIDNHKVSDSLREYVQQDSLGNLYIPLHQLPPHILGKMQGKTIEMQIMWLESKEQKASHKEGLGPFTRKERKEFQRLFPEEIKKLIKILNKKKKQGEKGFRTNHEIFTRVAQFLGAYWLENFSDTVPIDEDEPSGFGSRERVLQWASDSSHRGRASNETANIMLGQLMRYFLKEGETISYVNGYETTPGDSEKRGSVVSADAKYMVKVLYQAGDTEYLYDANPWNKEEHEHFKKNQEAYAVAEKEWMERQPQIYKSIEETMHDHADIPFTDIFPTETEESKRIMEQLAPYIRQNTFGDIMISFEHMPAAVIEKFQELRAHKLLKRITELFYQGFSEEEINKLDKYSPRSVLPGIIPEKARTGFLYKDEKDVMSIRLPDYRAGLTTILENFYGVDEQFQSFWRSTSEITGPEYSLKKLENPLYAYQAGIKSADIAAFFSSEETEKLLYDPALRTDIYNRMEKVFLQAARASSQNIDFFTRAVGDLEALRDEYKGKLMEVFRQEKKIRDPELFFQAVPFLLLIKHPLYFLENHYLGRRTIKSEENAGFIGSNIGMTANVDLGGGRFRKGSDIDRWRAYQDMKIENIRKALIEMEPIQNTIQEKTIGSTMIWEQALRKVKEEPPHEDGMVYLNPRKTFIELVRELPFPMTNFEPVRLTEIRE